MGVLSAFPLKIENICVLLSYRTYSEHATQILINCGFGLFTSFRCYVKDLFILSVLSWASRCLSYVYSMRFGHLVNFIGLIGKMATVVVDFKLI